MRLLEVLITWHPRCCDETMALRSMSGAQESSSISFFVASLHFGQVCLCFTILSYCNVSSFLRILQIRLHSNAYLFGTETEQGVAQAIIRSVIDFKRDPWPRVSESAKDLVRKMLEPDPKKRLSAAEVLGRLLLFSLAATELF